MIELVTFDWNGTLLADASACMAADNHVIKTFGGRPVDIKTYRETIIIPAINFYTKHGCNAEELLADPKKLGDTFHDFYEPRAARLRTRRGAKRTLSWLQEQAIPAIILSNHTVEGIGSQLDRLELRPYFRDLLANSLRNTSFQKRNKQEKLEAYLEEKRYDPRNVLIVGDTTEEIEMSKRLGLVGVAITQGYNSQARLRAAKPDYMIHNIGTLVNVIKELECYGG